MFQYHYFLRIVLYIFLQNYMMKEIRCIMNKIICIVGPTAVGKTDVSIALAKRLHTEIISADSVQIYQSLDIGSAKPTKEEMCGIIHHLLDFVSPFESFSVSEYVTLAKKHIQTLHEQGKTPVIVGGTGLYLNGLIYDMHFGESASDDAFRADMEELAENEGVEALHARLAAVDLDAASKIHPNNIRRVIRALEINHLTGKPVADFSSEPPLTKDYEVILIGLTRNRETLYDRINRRVDLMFDMGLLDEVKKLKNTGLNDRNQSMQGIGYKEVLSYLESACGYEEMKCAIAQNSRHYAKRQMTWFKRYPMIRWIDVDGQSTEEIIGEILSIS